MKNDEFLDAIGGIDPEYIESAATVKKQNHSRVWKAAIPAAACLCLLAGGMWILNRNGSVLTPSPAPELYILGEDNPSTVAEDPSSPQHEQITDGILAGPADGDGKSEQYSTTPMISSYGKSTYDGDLSVMNGGLALSNSLQAALQEYGNSANYRVLVELFRDGVQVSSASSLAQEEIDRLADAGYTVAVEKYNDGHTEQTYLTLHATFDQLEDFSSNAEFGYYILLYGEYFDTEGDLDGAVSGAMQPAK